MMKIENEVKTFDLGLIDKILEDNNPHPYTLVVLNAPGEHVNLQKYLDHASFVVCADGAANFVSLITTDFHLIGDMDSATAEV